MAEQKFVKGSEEWQMFNDYWKLCQHYWKPEEKDEYWKSLIADIDNFCRKYGNEIFPRKISLAFVETLEARSKEIRKEQ